MCTIGKPRTVQIVIFTFIGMGGLYGKGTKRSIKLDIIQKFLHFLKRGIKMCMSSATDNSPGSVRCGNFNCIATHCGTSIRVFAWVPQGQLCGAFNLCPSSSPPLPSRGPRWVHVLGAGRRRPRLYALRQGVHVEAPQAPLSLLRPHLLCRVLPPRKGLPGVCGWLADGHNRKFFFLSAQTLGKNKRLLQYGILQHASKMH